MEIASAKNEDKNKMLSFI